jgi:hypothetical protein
LPVGGGSGFDELYVIVKVNFKTGRQKE